MLVFLLFGLLAQCLADSLCPPNPGHCATPPIGAFSSSATVSIEGGTDVAVVFHSNLQQGFVYPFVRHAPFDRSDPTFPGTPYDSTFDSLPLYSIQTSDNVLIPNSCSSDPFSNNLYACSVIPGEFSPDCDLLSTTFTIPISEIQKESVCTQYVYQGGAQHVSRCSVSPCISYKTCGKNFGGGTCHGYVFDVTVSHGGGAEKTLDVVASSSVTWVNSGYGAAILEVTLPQDVKMSNFRPLASESDPLNFEYEYHECSYDTVLDTEVCDVGLYSSVSVSSEVTTGLIQLLVDLPAAEETDVVLSLPYSLKRTSVGGQLDMPATVYVGSDITTITTSTATALVTVDRLLYVVVSWTKSPISTWMFDTAYPLELLKHSTISGTPTITQLESGVDYTVVNKTSDLSVVELMDVSVSRDYLFEVFEVVIDGEKVGFGVELSRYLQRQRLRDSPFKHSTDLSVDALLGFSSGSPSPSLSGSGLSLSPENLNAGSFLDLIDRLSDLEVGLGIGFTSKGGNDIIGGSNAFAISGQHTKSGFPIVESDPHLAVKSPSVWLRVHLICREEGIDCAGIYLVGGYGVVMGHNREAAWGATVSCADTTELFVQKTRSTRMGFAQGSGSGSGSGSFQEDVLVDRETGEWAPLRIVQEVIHVKGMPDHVEKVRITPFGGPIISGIFHFSNEAVELGKKDSVRGVGTNSNSEKLGRDRVDDEMLFGSKEEFSLRTCATENFGFRNQRCDEHIMGELSLVRSWDDFRDIVSTVGLFSFNFVFGDRDGNIAMILSGAVPKRTPAAVERAGSALPGWDPDFRWGGFEEETPVILNPECGYVANCNNDSWTGRVQYYITNLYRPPTRVERIETLIRTAISVEELEEEGESEVAKKIDLETVMKIPLDVKHHNYRLVTRFARYALEPSNGSFDDECVRVAAEILDTFDGSFSVDSVGASVYASFLTQFVRVLLRHAGIRDEKLVGHLAGTGISPNFIGTTQYVCLRETLVDRLFHAVEDESVQMRLVRTSLSEAIQSLKNSVPSEVYSRFELLQDPDGFISSFPWGRVHSVVWSHPLSSAVSRCRVSSPTGGSWDTPFFTGYPTTGDNFEVVSAPSARMAVDLGDVEHGFAAIFPGQSGHFVSPFFSDCVANWAEGAYRPMLIAAPDIERNTYGEVVFRVK